MFWQPYVDKVRLIQQNKLVRLFHLDERSGTTANDYSPFSETGSYIGPTLANTIQPCGLNSAYFDGTNGDYVDILSNINTDWPDVDKQKGTIMIWVYKDNWSTTPKETCLTLWNNTSNRIEFWTLGGGGTLYLWGFWGDTERYVGVPVSGSGWHCLVLTWDTTLGPTSYVEAWKDGVSQGTDIRDNDNGQWSGNLNNAGIGDTKTEPSDPWEGNIGITAIWNDVLSDDDIKQISRI